MTERNVVLVCLDTVRKDYFDQYAPRLQELADVSVPQCRAASNWSGPSHATMFTGLLPHRHGVHAGTPSFASLERSTLVDDLPGHATLGVSANPYASSAYGFDAYFDEFVDVDDYTRYPDGLDVRQFTGPDGTPSFLTFLRAALAHDRPGTSLANGVLAAVTKLSEPLPVPRLFDHGASIVRRETLARVDGLDEPYFAFLNFMDAHTPLQHVRGFDGDLHDVPHTWICSTDRYNPWDVVADVEGHGTYLEYRRRLYAAAIEYLDRQVTGLIKDLRAASDRETTFVITADHGENLGFPADDGLVMHKGSLTESLLHVPFCVVDPPGSFPTPTPGDGTGTPYLSHQDLRSVLAAFAAGRSPNDHPSDRVAAEVVGLNGLTDASEIDDYDYWDRMIRCAYDGRSKVVWDSLGSVERYRVDFDTAGAATRVDRERDRDVDGGGATHADRGGEAASDPDAAVPDWARDLFEAEITVYKRRADSRPAAASVGERTRDRLRDLGYV